MNFLKKGFIVGYANAGKIGVSENNFVKVYQEWLREVKPFIKGLSYKDENGILKELNAVDFFLADLFSENDISLENLGLIYTLNKDHYETKGEKGGIINYVFDKVAHDNFWKDYERPPKYKDKILKEIIERRDQLLDTDLRGRKGDFFTPEIWVKKAHSYLAQVFGENFEQDYYIWDCAAGVGNLLDGFKNSKNLFASTLDEADVAAMKARSKDGRNFKLFENQIFQFDFLNDEFFDKKDKKGKFIYKSKLPENLQEILKDEKKREKLIILINPPYAEAGNKRKMLSKDLEHKDGVATKNETYENYKDILGKASNEIFAQFFIKIYKKIPNCSLAQFSTLKLIQGSNFLKFRQVFKAEFKKGFVVPASSFDNVSGAFPIGFMIWDLSKKENITKISLDVYDEKNKFLGEKNFYANSKNQKTLNEWLREFSKINEDEDMLGILMADVADFQHNMSVAILQKAYNAHLIFKTITASNLFPLSVYFAVRHAIKATWLNDRDQFLYPNDKWIKDKEFQNDCLAFMLFHSQNKISARGGGVLITS